MTHTHTAILSTHNFRVWPDVLLCVQIQGYQKHRQQYNVALGKLY